MKKYLMLLACISVIATNCTPVNAGLIHGGVKGSKKGVKEGVGGTAKGAKETAGGIKKGAKGAVGGIGKAFKTVF